jgi:hypothetical protein
MFQQGNYDVLTFSVPSQGMNQNISADVLPLDFAYVLENITTKPLGEGVVRFGTSFVMALPNLESTIIRQFPFTKADGSKQILLYVQEYVQDLTASEFTLFEDDPYSFSLNTDNEDRYVKDTPIKVVYTLNGLQTVTDAIQTKEEIAEDSSYKITLQNNAFPHTNQNPVIESVWYSSASIYVYDLETNILNGPLKQNLAVGCIPRGVLFLNQLVLCNGVDRILSYDGTDLSELYDFVKDPVTGLTRDGNQQLSFDRKAGEDYSRYSMGSKIQLVINGTVFQTTLTAFVETTQKVMLAVANVLPQFVQNQTFLFYQAFPPAFNYLYVAYDRLWALGPGAAGLEYRNAEEAMRVYFMYKSNSLTDWFDERTGEVPNINLASKHGIPDNLEAIDLINGYMAFIGREKTQVWQGSEPEGAIAAPNREPLNYNRTLNTGVIHGDLLLDLSNDTWFVSNNGMQSVSSLNVAQQFSATSFDAVDPLVREYNNDLLQSNLNYRSALSFHYTEGGFAGFKIGNTNVLCSLVSTSLYSWSLFSGDFRKATSFLSLGNCLYLSIKNKLYRYADGHDSNPKGYGDQGGEALIPFSWTLPVISIKGKSFACKRYEVQLDYPSSFTVNSDNFINLSISGDLPKSYQITSPCRFDLRGDALKTLPLIKDAISTQNSIGFRFDQPYGFTKDRLKFIASRFWLTLKGYTQAGPLSLRQIKLYGIIER